MRLVAPILIISWGVCLAGAAREKLGDGDVESLRRMVRNSIFDPVKPNTLPFSSLQEQLPPRTRRKKICAECMAKLLALVSGPQAGCTCNPPHPSPERLPLHTNTMGMQEFEEFLPEGGRPIQQMADTQTWNDEGRLIYVDALVSSESSCVSSWPTWRFLVWNLFPPSFAGKMTGSQQWRHGMT